LRRVPSFLVALTRFCDRHVLDELFPFEAPFCFQHHIIVRFDNNEIVACFKHLRFLNGRWET
jgi:hypothetical protein